MNGIILIDKPQGWTSHDVVGKLRGILHERRIGHSGTLDPLATGLLVVFIGRATRAVEFAEADRKEYVAGLRLGMSTDTQDITGRIISKETDIPDEPEVRIAIERFRGELEQIPPMYSAVKIGGKKLYELARKGEEIQRSARNITIFELELLGKSDDGDWMLRVRCSKGTYVRTLCHDIGQALGCGGCMSSLRRTMAAGFTLAESHTLEEVQQAGESLLAPTDSLFRQYPAYRLATEKADRACRCGNPIPASDLAEGLYRVYGLDGQFLCLSSWKNGALISQKNFFGA